LCAVFFHLQVIENDLSEQDLGLTFSVEREAFGAYEEVELKSGGKDIVVTEDNKREYVDLLAEWRLKGGLGESALQVFERRSFWFRGSGGRLD
jgi:hypothetical protein